MRRSLVYPAVLLVIFIIGTTSLAVTPREAVYFFPVEPVMSNRSAPNSEWADIPVFFRGQAHPPVIETIGQGRSDREANAIFRSDPRACRVAFLASVRGLQKQAWDEGGNALVDVHSYGAGPGTPGAATKYRCVARATNASVRLRGDVVRIDAP